LSPSHAFGELERVFMVENLSALEGDVGDILIRIAVTSIEQLK
jgi:hypothetical protein